MTTDPAALADSINNKIATARTLCARLGAEAFAEYADLLPGFDEHYCNVSSVSGMYHTTHRRGDDVVLVHHFYGKFHATATIGGKAFDIDDRHNARAAVSALLSQVSA